MCGIAGLFSKDQKSKADLGGLLAGMLSSLSERRPDSAGFAVYGAKTSGRSFETENEPEVAAGFITAKLRRGGSLKDAAAASFTSLDGCYACGKSQAHTLEHENLVALNVEAAAMARVPLAGTD